MLRDLGKVEQGVRAGECKATRPMLRRLDRNVAALPNDVDAGVRTTLDGGLDQLERLVGRECKQREPDPVVTEPEPITPPPVESTPEPPPTVTEPPPETEQQQQAEPQDEEPKDEEPKKDEPTKDEPKEPKEPKGDGRTLARQAPRPSADERSSRDGDVKSRVRSKSMRPTFKGVGRAVDQETRFRSNGVRCPLRGATPTEAQIAL